MGQDPGGINKNDRTSSRALAPHTSETMLAQRPRGLETAPLCSACEQTWPGTQEIPEQDAPLGNPRIPLFQKQSRGDAPASSAKKKKHRGSLSFFFFF